MKSDKKSTVSEEDIDGLMAVFATLSPLDIWSTVKRTDFTVRRFAGGFLSDIACCELTAEAKARLVKGRNDLPAVVVKYDLAFGHFKVNRLEAATAQVLMSELGITPHITYFGPQCTIAQFIPSRPYGLEDDLDPVAVKQVLKMLATMHSLRPPISKGQGLGLMEGTLRERLEREKNGAFGDKAPKDLKGLAPPPPPMPNLPMPTGALPPPPPPGESKRPNMAAVAEKEYMKHLVKESPAMQAKYRAILEEIDHLAIDDFNQDLKAGIDSPMVFSHNDLNRGNRLVQTRLDGSKRIYLVDFDFSGFASRGRDLGRFFSTFKQSQDVFMLMPVIDQLSEPLDFGQPYFPPDEELRSLLEVYRTEAARVQGTDFVNDPRNSIDHLMDEVKVHTLFAYDDFTFGLMQYCERSDMGQMQKQIYLDSSIFRYKAWKSLKTRLEADGTVARLLKKGKK